ncbi:MAG: porin family protein [Candidatus Latescibacterota bacterium]
MASYGTARADERQIRIYTGIDDTVMERGAFALQPFVREYSRFVKGKYVYQQWNIGVRMGHASWLSTQVYYSPRDRMYPGSPRTHKHLTGFDILFTPAFGKFELLDREANEWHITDRYYRFRNLMQIMYVPRDRRLSPYVYNEFRADSDQKRINVYGTGFGFRIDPASFVTLRLYYHREGDRRNRPDWKYSRYLAFSLTMHL